MPSPVTPNDFKEVIPGPTGSLCDKLFGKLLRRGAELDYAMASYFFNENGTDLSNSFKADLCLLNCAGTGTGTGTGTGPGDSTITVPINVSATDGVYSDKVVVTWSKVMGATGYSVWRAASNNVNGATQIGAVTGESTLTFTDTAVDQGVTYYYYVRTITATGTSRFGGPDTGYASATFAGQITDLEASQGVGRALSTQSFVYLTFTAVAGADSYNIFRNTTDDFSTATLIGSNRVPYDNSEDFNLYPPGENPIKPYFVNGGNFLTYLDVLDSATLTDHYTPRFYWAQPCKASGGQITAVGTVSDSAQGWEAGDGLTSGATALGDSLAVGRLSITVPAGKTKAWIAVNGCAGNGAGGSDTAGGGGGGGPSFASGTIPVSGGDVLEIVYTPNSDPARAPQLTNGPAGSTVDIKLNGAAIVTLTPGQGGVYDSGGAGAGGVGGTVSLNSLSSGRSYSGRDGLPAVAVGLKGGRGGSSHFGFRAAPAHFGTAGSGLSWPGDSSNGAGGSRALPGASSSAQGGVAARNPTMIVFYT